MKIIETCTIEDCFDGSRVLGYTFDSPWTREEIVRLEALGDVDYFPDFPRPYFRLRTSHGAQVKGVQGDRTCRAIFPKDESGVAKHVFERLFIEST